MLKMEGKRESSDAEFDLLGMLFPGDGLDCRAYTSLSRYLTDDDRLPRGADFEVPANASVSMASDDEDYLHWSLANVVDLASLWNSSFCFPAVDFSGNVSGEIIRNDIATMSDSHVATADSIPVEDDVSADKGLKRKGKSVTSGKSANSAMETAETPKKRPRQYRVKRQEHAKARKNQRVVDKDAFDNDNNGHSDDNVIVRQDGQSPASSCSSEVDLNSRQLSPSNDIKDDSSAVNNTSAAEVKPRASRAAVTDPQSLCARRRRERISERLRMLQILIPSGTKVDISTMLEEAVHYVKFLQIQINLFSSDELWIYAPISHNWKDIGLNLNLFCPSQP